ncbi:MAG: TM0996/MTH895 family glutaredoxin-like protein [Euryarchaeota archaeon]|nr:TM0996/MTH895 family glutaredoxin-like protein [Euryarchaeota archaeon]MCG2711659.1 thioredoxin family protein [Candidatus Omnitrophota bacterium]
MLGPGCAKCDRLEKKVKKVINELGLKDEVIKVKDITKIMEYDIIMTPALVIDGEVKSAGRIPAKDEIKKWIDLRT